MWVQFIRLIHKQIPYIILVFKIFSCQLGIYIRWSSSYTLIYLQLAYHQIQVTTHSLHYNGGMKSCYPEISNIKSITGNICSLIKNTCRNRHNKGPNIIYIIGHFTRLSRGLILSYMDLYYLNCAIMSFQQLQIILIKIINQFFLD